jgi:hypothetical protein
MEGLDSTIEVVSIDYVALQEFLATLEWYFGELWRVPWLEA